MPDESGRVFRDAWIAGVRQHYPGDPKPGYVSPWEETPGWERESAAAVEELVRALVKASAGTVRHLTRDQKGQFVALCWITQIYRHFPEPKATYVAPWDQLPQWQRETDADIFEHIEGLVTTLP